MPAAAIDRPFKDPPPIRCPQGRECHTEMIRMALQRSVITIDLCL
jgi:hypothetical protein